MEENLKKRFEKLEQIPVPDKDELIQNVMDKSSSLNLHTGEFENIEKQPKNKRGLNRAIFLLRPAFAVLTILVVILIAYAYNQNAEYQKAYAFFEENKVDIDSYDLTKEEIKDVYQDINTNTFTNATSKQIIEDTVVKATLPKDVTPEQLKIIWTTKDKSIFMPSHADTTDEIEYGLVGEENPTTDTKSNYYFKVTKGGKSKLAYFTNLYIFGYEKYNDNFVVFGQDESANKPKIAYLDSDLNVIWEKPFETPTHGTILKVFTKGEHITVFGQANASSGNSIVFKRYDLQGNLVKENTLRYIHAFHNVYQMDETYIVQLESKNFTKLIVLDNDANMLISTDFKLDDRRYVIEDIKQDDQYLYISTTSYPHKDEIDERLTFENDTTFTDRDSIEQIVTSSDHSDINADVTDQTKTNFEASLFLFDLNFQKPQLINNEKGVLGSTITLDTERFKWNVLSIKDAKLSLATSAFSIIINTEIKENVFANNLQNLPISPTATIEQYKKVEIRR